MSVSYRCCAALLSVGIVTARQRRSEKNGGSIKQEGADGVCGVCRACGACGSAGQREGRHPLGKNSNTGAATHPTEGCKLGLRSGLVASTPAGRYDHILTVTDTRVEPVGDRHSAAPPLLQSHPCQSRR